MPLPDHPSPVVGTVGVIPSPDGTQTWMMYQGEPYNGGSGGEKTLRVKAITWNSDNTPNLGTPDPLSTSLTVPSGETEPWGWGDSPLLSANGTWSFDTPTSASVTSEARPLIEDPGE